MQLYILKKYARSTCFLMVLIVFIYCYYTGPHGVSAYKKLYAEYTGAVKNLETTRAEVDQIRGCISAYSENSFIIEKYAREQLCMAYPGESVYIFTQ